jgi:Fe-S-cluster-containing dehydrogenase component
LKPADEVRKSQLTRRKFLRYVGVGAGSLLVASYAPQLEALASLTHEEVEYGAHAGIKYAPPPLKGVRYGMAIDVEACIGCRKCAYACFKENNIGRDSGFLYIQLLGMEKGTVDLEEADYEYTKGAEPDKWYFPIQCQQCANPPCVQACPVGATWKEPDGIVVIDYDKCIGCRYCMVACPYGARHFNWKRPYVPKKEINEEVPVRPIGVVEKCTFCIHRVRQGKPTRCVEACPVQARKFGNLNDPESPISLFLESRRPFRLKEELGTQPRIWFAG